MKMIGKGSFYVHLIVTLAIFYMLQAEKANM